MLGWLSYQYFRWRWMHSCIRCCGFTLGTNYMCRKCDKATRHLSLL